MWVGVGPLRSLGIRDDNQGEYMASDRVWRPVEGYDRVGVGIARNRPVTPLPFTFSSHRFRAWDAGRLEWGY